MTCHNVTLSTQKGKQGVVAMELMPGQLSLHNALTLHCSHAGQQGAGRRVGLALRYDGGGGVVVVVV